MAAVRKVAVVIIVATDTWLEGEETLEWGSEVSHLSDRKDGHSFNKNKKYGI